MINVTMPRVDVILACFNGGQFIEKQLNSVLGQIDVSVRVFVFDDCSSDDTREIVESLMARDSRVVLQSRQVSSGGAFQSFRAAINDFYPGSDYVAFCDQDDFWVPEKLALQVSAMEKECAVGCSTSVTTFSNTAEFVQRLIDNSGKQSKIDHFFESAGQGCTYLFRIEAFQLLRRAYKVIDCEEIYHDWLLYSLCRAYNKKWIILSSPLVHYRQHANNAFGARDGLSGKFRRLMMLMSGDYRTKRLRLANVLDRLPGVVNTTPSMLLRDDLNFFQRFSFAVPRLFQFRRFRFHSVVVFLFFILNKA